MLEERKVCIITITFFFLGCMLKCLEFGLGFWNVIELEFCINNESLFDLEMKCELYRV